jgi:hypothetical protein
MKYIINTTNLIRPLLSLKLYYGSNSRHFSGITYPSQETLHELRFGDYCVQLCCGLDLGCGNIVMNFVIQITQNHI